jgi:hypothetical protein
MTAKSAQLNANTADRKTPVGEIHEVRVNRKHNCKPFSQTSRSFRVCYKGSRDFAYTVVSGFYPPKRRRRLPLLQQAGRGAISNTVSKIRGGYA